MKTTCRECDGRKFGRGFNHKPGCSLASKVNGKPVRQRNSGRGRLSKGAVSIEAIARMPIDAVIEIRRAANDALRNRQGEVRKMISNLKGLLG